MKTINPTSCFLGRQNLHTSLIILFFVLITTVVGAQTPSFYNNAIGASSNTQPLNASVNKAQWLYGPNLFASGGTGVGTPAYAANITKIYFRFATTYSATKVYPDFTISLGQNVGTATTVTSTTFNTGLTQCYFLPSTTLAGGAINSWYGITLQTPFPYDPNLSLVFEMKTTNTTTGGCTVAQITTGGNQRVTGTFAATTGSIFTGLVNFGFDLSAAGGCSEPAVAGTATAIPATVCAGASVNLNLTGNSSGTGQTYQWQRNTGSGFVNIGAPLSSPGFSDVPPSNAIYRCIAQCSAGATVPSSTVSVTVMSALAGGTYTINSALPTGGGNYQTFTAAVAAMSCGITGAVTFDVAPGSGPYTEQVTIPTITGASAVNTITFNGNGRTLQFTPVTAARHILKLDGADFVTINSLNIVGLATDFGWGVHLMNSANNNTISNCTISMNAVTSITLSASAGIAASNSTTSVTTAGNNASNLTITGCTITGGYHGINLNGLATGLNAVNNIVTNNIIEDTHGNGIELVHNDGALVQGNNISRPTRTTMLSAAAGIEIGTGNRNVLINANRIHDTHNQVVTQSGTAYGIFFSSCDAPVGMENRVTNNLIYNFNSETGIQYGLYNVGSDGVRYYHNTVVFDDAAATSGTTYAFHQTTAATNIEFKNNLMYVTRGGTGTKNCLRFATPASSITSNNNALYINSPAGTNGIGFYNAINSVTLNDWLINNSNLYDAASVSADPVFVNPGAGNYQPYSFLLDNIGTDADVNTDILGAPRNATTPDPGAYEFTVPAIDASIIAFVSPGTSGCYTTAETIIVTIKNFGSSVLNFSVTPLTVNCNVSGAMTATLTGIPTGTLAQGATMNITLSPVLDMTANGVYTFNASTSIAGDGNSSNDALPAVTRTVGIIPGIVTATPNQICISGSTTLTLDGLYGGTVQWQENTSSWTNVGTGGTSFTPSSPVTQNTSYRAVVSCNTNSVISNEVTVSVNNPVVASTVPGTRCGLGTVCLSATPNNPAYDINWYASATGGQPLAAATNTYCPAVSSTTTFYAEASAAGTSSTGAPELIYYKFDSPGATVQNQATTPVGTNPSAIIGLAIGGTGQFGLGLTGTGLASSSNNVNTGWATSFPSSWTISMWLNLPTPPTTRYFFGDVNAGSLRCFTGGVATNTGLRLTGPLTFDLLGLPIGTSPFVVHYVYDSNTGILSGYINGALWASQSIPGLTISGAGPFFVGGYSGTNGSIQGTMDEFRMYNRALSAAEITSTWNVSLASSCASPRVPVLAEVTESPDIDVQSTAPAVCPGQTVDLSVNSPTNDPNYTYAWTSMPAGFIASGPGPHTVSPSVTTEYIVFAQDNSSGPNAGCTAQSSVIVTAGASGGTVTSDKSEICLSGIPTLTVTGAGGGPLQWQESPTGLVGSWINVGSGGTTYAPSLPITQTMYYQVVVSCGIFPVLSNMVTVTVNNPAVLTTAPATRCGTGTVGLSATASAGNVLNWYDVPNGGAPLPGGAGIASGSTFTTPAISGNTNFYVAAQSGGGVQSLGPNNLSIGAFANFSALVQFSLFTVHSPTTIQSVDCFWGGAVNSPFTIVIQNADAGNAVVFSYSGTTTVTGSTVSQVIPLNATLNPGNYRFGFSVNPGCYRNSTGGVYPYTIPGVISITGSTFNAGYYYFFYRWQVGVGCEGTRVPVAATVTPAPAIIVTSADDLTCPGSSTTVSVSSPTNDPNYTYTWTSNPAGFTATGPGPHTVTPTVNTIYSVSALDNTAGPNTGCAAFGSVAVKSANSYCAAVNNTGACITNVTLNTLNNSTGCQSGAPFYSFQSATTTLNQGFTYELSVTVNSDIYGLGIVSVWIDWNKDGVFSVSEWYQPYTSALTGSVYITVPSTVFGNVVMRVRSRGAGNTNGSGDACVTMGSGETEDYCINVIPAPPVPPTCVANVYPADASSISCATGTTTLTWATGPGGGLPAGYNVYFGNTPIPPAAPSNPQTTLTYSPGPLSPGTYYWRVEPFNGFGTTTTCAVNSFIVPTPAVGTITQSALSGCGISSLVTVDITGGWTGALSLEYEAPAGSNNWLPVVGVSTLPVVINVPLPGGEFYVWGFRAAITDCQNGKIYSNNLTYIQSNPAAPADISTVSRCGPGIVTTSASVSAGHSLEWWDAATGGNLLGSGSPFNYTASGNTTIYAASRHTASNCLGPVRSPQEIIVHPLPTTSAANNGPFCVPATTGATAMATLTATGSSPFVGANADILSPLAPSNGSSAVGFDVQNTSASPVTIHFISFASSATLGTNQTESVYYRTSAINCIAQGNITTNPAWILIGSAVAVSAGPYPALTQLPLDINITIPAGQTYAFAVGGNGIRYEGTGTTCNTAAVVSDANLSIYMGFGGTLASTLNFRRFVGKVSYSYLVGTGVNFTWTPGVNCTLPDCSEGTANLQGSATPHQYTVTITDIHGCTATGTTSVTVNKAPNIVSLQSATLNGGAVTTIPSPPTFLDIPVFTETTTCDKMVNYNVDIAGFPDPDEVVGGITHSFSGATTGSGSGTGSGSAFGRLIPTGRTTVAVTATNLCGSQTKQFRVTVTDNVAPVITPIQVAATSTNGGDCASEVQVTQPDLTNGGLFDNCPNASIIFVNRSDGRSQFEPYYAGTTTVTWQATDASANVITATQDVVVNNFKPVINSFTTSSNVIFVGQTATFTVDFTDEDGGGTHTVKFYRDKNDATPANTKVLGPNCTQSCNGTRSYVVTSDPIMYPISEVAEPKVEVLDGCNLAADQNPGVSTYMYLAVAVAGQQFTTAGGHFLVPAGAANPGASWEGYNVSIGNIVKKATTGNSYKGQLEMNVHIPNQPDWRVHTDNGTNSDITWDYLTIGGCSLATFKGAVRVNGQTGFKVLVQQSDKDRNPATSNFIRVKVSTNSGTVIFDTQPGLTEALTSGNGGAAAIITALTNGSIKVQPANGCVAKIDDEASDELLQNIPNPFTNQTEIRFSVPQDGQYTLAVYNYLGQEVATLFNAEAVEGSTYSVMFDGSNFEAGIYTYTLRSANVSKTRRMNLVK